eukprot:4587289-Prymnesium_polylepis.2
MSGAFIEASCGTRTYCAPLKRSAKLPLYAAAPAPSSSTASALIAGERPRCTRCGLHALRAVRAGHSSGGTRGRCERSEFSLPCPLCVLTFGSSPTLAWTRADL